MLKKLCVAALMLAVSTVTLPASAFIIDSFDDTQSLSADSGTVVDFGDVAGGMLGGDRNMLAVYTSGPNSVDAEVNAGGSSLLNISLGADTLGSVQVFYDGIGGVGLGGIDLTAGGTLNAIAMQIPFDDLPVDIQIGVNSPAGNSVLTQTLPGGIFSSTSLPFLFDDFTVATGTGADFASVDLISIVINPLFPATDLQIDFIETTFVSTVPEPATYALAAMGLCGLALYGRRRRA